MMRKLKILMANILVAALSGSLVFLIAMSAVQILIGK
jgi:hypothetical protein